MSKQVLVIGGNKANVQAALDMADCGLDVTLVEESPTLPADGGNGHSLLSMPMLLRAANHPRISLVTGANITRVSGEKGEFKARILKQPRYVNLDLCTSCGKCEVVCPVTIHASTTEDTGDHKAIHRSQSGLKTVPSTLCIDKQGLPPCTASCPAGVNVQGYVALISQGKFAEALDLVTEAVPFPRVLGRVCNHPCETNCTRSRVDSPVSICSLKRFVGDNNPTGTSLRRSHRNNGRPLKGRACVAIIGAGPAGLTAARDLARMGHRSTVFEALPAPGGMITVGMPRFRLPREIRQADIEDILSLGGIEIKTSTRIGTDLTFDDLKRQGYKAILIAIGAHKNQKLGIQGEGLQGVMNSITLLEAFNLKKPISVGSRVIVIGGGYTGIDSARTAVRLNCKRVLCVDRCAREDLLANADEVAEAGAEGVEFDYLVTPVRITGQDGKVTGVEFRRMQVSKEQAGGRRQTVPIEGSEFFVAADTVIVAVGQRPDLSFLAGDITLTEGRKHVIADPVTQATRIPGIFAAGDASHDCAPMINAVAAGRRAAISIDGFLRGEKITRVPLHGKAKPVNVNIEEIYIPPIERQPMPLLSFEDRIGNFEEVELGFGEEAAVMEARRCLNCGGCSACMECIRTCELNAINHEELTVKEDIEAAAIIFSGADDSMDRLFGSKKLSANSRPGIYVNKMPDVGGLSYASALAARVMADMPRLRPENTEKERVRQHVVMHEIAIAQAPLRHQAGEPRIAVFICGCGGSIRNVVDLPEVVRSCRSLGNVVHCDAIGYACNAEAANDIKNIAWQNNLTHVVLAACACCNLDQICFSCSDRRIQCKDNLLNNNGNGNTSYEFVNIREHCAWVHRNNPEEATRKAKTIIKAGLARTIRSLPFVSQLINIEQSALVIGAGRSGTEAALNLATRGIPTTVMAANGINSSLPDTENKLLKSGATVMQEAMLLELSGTPGRYQAVFSQNDRSRSLTFGAVIIDRSSIPESLLALPLLHKAIEKNDNYGRDEGISACAFPGIFVCGGNLPKGKEPPVSGMTAAGKAAVFLSKGMAATKEAVPVVGVARCRGCGTCVSVCPFYAASLVERSAGVSTALIDEGLCQGCGICVAHCPSGALNQNIYSEEQISASLESILL